jgi:hypothetical protein
VSAAAVAPIIKDLAALAAPKRADIERILKATLPLEDDNPYYEIFKAPLAGAPFASAELRVNKADPDQGLLILKTTAGDAPKEAELSLDQYGPVVAFDVNPRIPPEGVVSKVMKAGPVKLSFQMTAKTKALSVIALEWKADA